MSGVPAGKRDRTDTDDFIVHGDEKNGPMKLISGTAHRSLAEDVSQLLQVPLVWAEIGRFADGEINVQIKENVRGGDVFILQSTCFPVSDHIMELLCLVDACRRASARRITCVIPYFAYARRDRIAKGSFGNVTQIFGNPPRLVANLLSKAGVNRVVTVDVMGQIQGMFNIPVDHLTALPVLAEYFLVRDLTNPVVLAPNVSSTELARNLAERIGAGLAIMDKRDYQDGKEARLVGSVDGCDTIIVKDSIDSGKNLARATKLVKSCGARRVLVAAVHPCFSNPNEAAEMIGKAGLDECVLTNSTPLADGDAMKSLDCVKVLSLNKLLAQAILRIHQNASVTVLFSSTQAKFSKLERKNLSLSMEDINFALKAQEVHKRAGEASEGDTTDQ